MLASTGHSQVKTMMKSYPCRLKEGETMFRRTRYQRGSLQRVKRKVGPAVWIFRWYEIQADGSKKYRKAVIGSVEEFRTETEAQTAADALRININRETPRA